MSRSTFRGYTIVERDGEWYFEDTGEPTIEMWKQRPCGHCKKFNTSEGHDACLGELPGVMNACCGHGEIKQSYIQFNNGVTVRGFYVQQTQ